MSAGNLTKRLIGFAGTGRKRAIALVAAAVVAATAVTAGLALPAGASTVAAKPAGAGGTEHFQMMNTSTSQTTTTNPIVAWGIFTAAGTDHEYANNTDTFAFPGGTFTVKHVTTPGTAHQYVNAQACLFIYSEKGTFKLSGGTGRYWGIGGSGTYALSVIGIGARLASGACNMSDTAPLAGQQQEISAVGKVWLPHHH
jgi:hypothetical protein